MSIMLRDDLHTVLENVQKAVAPGALMKRQARQIRAFFGDGKVHLFALGKASALMTNAAVEMVNDGYEHITVMTSPQFKERITRRASQHCWLLALACEHPMPTERNCLSTLAASANVRAVPPDHRLLVLMSGGASAYLTFPAEGLNLEDVVACTGELMRRGASIRELNVVRKHIDRLKGGKLGRMCSAASTLVLVISDVIGDPLDVIGSGPFVADQSTAEEAIEVLRRYGLWGSLPRVEAVLEAGRNAAAADNSWESRVTHKTIGNNQMAVRAVVRSLKRLGYQVALPFKDCEGDVESVAAKLLGAKSTGGKQAWVLGGEWVVNAAGTSGVGGPSQELALRAAVAGQGERGWALLAYSTDGIDGPTSAAGAVVCGETVGRMRAAGIDAPASLANHDSHAALKASGDLITTGLTGTNVNHIAVLLRDS